MFSDFGHNVVCIDKDINKIERLRRGESPIYEPGLEEIRSKHKGKNFHLKQIYQIL